MTQVAAVVAAGLFLAMAAFQASLAAGAPLGAHVFGGRNAGMLAGRLRLISGVAAALLPVFAGVVLARAGAVSSPEGLAGLLTVSCWLIAGFLVLNTLGNLVSKSRFERTVFAGTTGVLAALTAYVALAA